MSHSHDNTYAEDSMFTTLPESRAIRSRSARGTLVSVMLHGALIAVAAQAYRLPAVLST